MFLDFKKLKKNTFSFYCNVLVALFFITVLSFNKGYSYAPMILGVISTIFFFVNTFKREIKWDINKEDKYFIFSLVFYFFTFLLSVVFNSDSLRVIDNPSRVLLLLPLIFLFKVCPIKEKTVLYFIPLGAFLVGAIAIYQKFFLQLMKPFPETMHIQAGNISMTLCLLTITIMFYWFNKGEYKNALICVLCAILGFGASILTGARGGWIAFPFCLIIILLFNIKNFNKKLIISFSAILAIILTLFMTRAEFGVLDRYHQAESDIVNYFENKDKTSSLGARFDMWENALIAISEKPLLGYGDRGYEGFKQKQIANNQMAPTTLSFNSLHNQYLEAFVKRGILGILGLIGVLAIPLIIFVKKIKSTNVATKYIAIMGITHIVAHSIFFLSQSFLAHNSGSLFYFFVLILLYHLASKADD